MKVLSKYSVGTGDRFGRQGEAQIRAFQLLAGHGVEASIVWNKSNREHVIIGTAPKDQRAAADTAVAATGFTGSYCVDADHIGLQNVDWFIPWCDFFTIDVADFIGKPASAGRIRAFIAARGGLVREKTAPVAISAEVIEKSAKKYLYAIDEAAKVYVHILAAKPEGNFHVEVSMDETDEPQTPAELAVILAGLAEVGVPVQTIAPKFSGRFNKGVDYVGEPEAFLKEFEADAKVATWAVGAFGLPSSLKLSIHTGSDKFSLYRGMGTIIKKLGCGLHLKTAGTSWLEELIGLAEAGGEGLAIAKRIYAQAYARYDELQKPYATVIDISMARLPQPGAVNDWDSAAFVSALRHDARNPLYNRDLRQLLHIGFKVAAEMGDEYLDALDTYKAQVGRNVSANLFERHLTPLFLG
ncbi:MAG: tagaturonate epimerase family protein [Rectinemataceae bacterium]